MTSFTRIRGARLLCALTSCCFALAIWCASPSFAANSSAYDNKFGANKKLAPLGSGTPGHVNSGSLTGTLVRTVVALLVVIASLPLGPNRSVALVRVGAELHMLGVAEQGINGIRVFSEEEAYELGIPFDNDDVEAPSSPAGAIGQRLIEALRRLTAR